MSAKNIEAIYPLSPMQEGMLFHTLYAPASGVYFEQLSCVLVGALDHAIFRQAWQHIVDRHAVLRTLFVWEKRDKPLQVVRQPVTLPWMYHDWRDIAPDEQEQRLAAFLVADRAQGFELMQAPLMRCAVIQMDDTVYRFVWSFHHLLLDGWSVSQVLQEAFAAYETLYHRQPLHMEPVRPYRDYVVWLQNQDTAKAESFWRQALSGFTTPTPLGGRPVKGQAIYPTDQERDYARFRIRLDLKSTAALHAIAKQYRLTLNTLAQGVWALLLSRYAGEQDVLFGVTVSGRPAEMTGVETMVGLFINTLPLRVHIPAQGTLLAWLEALQMQQADVRQYEYCALTDIQQWSDVPSNLPLFESILVFENYPTGAILQSTSVPLEEANRWYKADGLEIRDIRFFERTNYPLTIAVEPGTELVLDFSYNQAHLDDATIRRMAEHIRTLLENMPAYLERPLTSLPMLTQVEQQQLLVEWNATQIDFPEVQCLHQLFEAQVERTPDAIAVVFGEQTLTYRELNERANQLAHYLQKLDVGPESLVAICLERSPEMVIGIFGVLKAGGAYVPIDPMYPPERQAFILEDTRAAVLLTQQEFVIRLLPSSTVQKHVPAHIICLDTDWNNIKQEGCVAVSANVTSRNLAYVLFTSGSTGQPKGVAIEHHGPTALLGWAQRIFTREDLEGVLASTSICFDLSIFEIFLPLSVGGSIILVDNALALSAPLPNVTITLVNTVPSAMTELLKTNHLPPSVQVVNLAGEPLRTELVRHIYQQGSVQKVFDLYGPSEDTTYTTFALRNSAGPETIGRPIDNTQVYILDEHLQSVPIGIVGELFISGAGLARGYLHRAGTTAQKFLPNPFASEPGMRMYRTGDLARYLPDGNIEFLGRIDHQVKIRGFRIELGEIETVLAQHPAVRESVVTAMAQQAAENQRLVTYFVATEGATPSPDELRAYLKSKLPDYMIPSIFIRLTTFPLTPNGKTDRRALPKPENLPAQQSETYIAPRTPLEQQLAGIWEEVLGIEQIGIHDDFFALGGHSLHTMQLVSKIAAATHHLLPIKAIFLHPTVETLALALNQAMSDTEPGAEQLAIVVSQQQNALPTSPPVTTAPSFLQLERRSLLTHFALGNLAPVDAAALAYLDNNNTEHQALLQDWFDDKPLFTDVLETALGRIALIYIPILEAELYSAKARLTEAIIDSLKMAQHLGARVVSLPGLLPSATEYGMTIHHAAAARPGLPAVTTGQATIAAAVFLMIEKILEQGGRDLTQEHVGILGLGSIGATCLRMMLKTQPHPKTIILSDLYSKPEALRGLGHEIVNDLGFKGTVHIAQAQGQAPAELYEASLIVGATNVPEVLDISQINPGTLIVDDSASRCFNREHAIQRFERHADILFTEGDILRTAHPIRQTSFMPQALEGILPRYRRNAFTITGCVLSGLLSVRFEHLRPTLGVIEMKAGMQHYQTLRQLAFAAADLHSENYILDPVNIQRFRQHFGNNTIR